MHRSRKHRPLLALAAAFAVLTPLTAFAEDHLPPPSELLYIAGNCTPITPGTCGPTRWLGKLPGNAVQNSFYATTPVNEVVYRYNGSREWASYVSDRTLREDGYALRSDEPIKMSVTVTAQTLAANTTVHGRLFGYSNNAGEVLLGEASDVVTIVGPGSETVTFEFAVPESLDGVVMANFIAEVAVHGINARGGYVDERGGSTVMIPYYEDAPEATAPPE